MPLTKYGPKEALSPSVGTPGSLCGVAFVVGDYTVKVRATHDRKYGNARLEVHWNCANKIND